MRNRLHFARVIRRFTQNEISPNEKANSDIKITKEQYDAQKLVQVDQRLNLNTYQFPVNQNERKVNSQFIEVVGKEDPAVIAVKSKRKMVSEMLENRIKTLPILRNLIRASEHGKILTKPKIEKLQLTPGDETHYDYLTNPRADDDRVMKFIALEKKYADTHFSAGGRKAMKMTQAWFREYKQFYDDYPFFCDRGSYSVSANPAFELQKRSFHNTDALLDFKNAKPQIVFDQHMIMEYLMGFKDDFSYFVCRFLKNNLIDLSKLERVSISDNEQFIAVSLQLEDKHLTIIRDVENSKFFNFYFNRQMDIISFHTKNGRDYYVVFKAADSNEIRQIAISPEQFSPPKPLPGLIESVTKFMRDRQADLVVNDYKETLSKSTCLLALDLASIKVQLQNFGRQAIIKCYSNNEDEFSLFYMQGSEVMSLGVR